VSAVTLFWKDVLQALQDQIIQEFGIEGFVEFMVLWVLPDVFRNQARLRHFNASRRFEAISNEFRRMSLDNLG
jgi:hypothetical protein